MQIIYMEKNNQSEKPLDQFAQFGCAYNNYNCRQLKHFEVKSLLIFCCIFQRKTFFFSHFIIFSNNLTIFFLYH